MLTTENPQPTRRTAVPDRKTDDCSQLCRAADEPMLGSAIEVDVWLLLEYRRAWAARALDDNQLDHATQNWLRSAVDRFAAVGLTARPQFIRRPQRSDGRHLFIARNGRLGAVIMSEESALLDVDPLSDPLPEVSAPHYFVCTNARRDICCAKFGRPTYAALHREVGGRAWQTTHVGGHRYAPNVLALPQAALYGRVYPDDVPSFVACIEGGRLDRRFLRGSTGYSPIAQAAEGALPAATALLAETHDSATFATPDGPKTVQVRAGTPIEVLASCNKPPKLATPLQTTVLPGSAHHKGRSQ